MRNPGNEVSAVMLTSAAAAVRSKGLRLEFSEVREHQRPEDENFAVMSRAAVQGLVVIPDAIYASVRRRLAELAIKNRLPVVFARDYYAQAGGLVSYGPSVVDDFIRAGRYVDKIFKGVKSLPSSPSSSQPNST